MSVRVVGLDLSMTATGICEADGTTRTVRFTSDTAGDARLVHIAGTAGVACIGADLVVIEDLPTHAMAAGITGMVHGAVRADLISEGVPYVLITPATLKKYATGRGNAGKPEMAVALFKRFGLELTDDNQVDAFWLRAAGHDLLGQPLVQMPLLQVAALDVVRRQLGGAA
jgi:Holliday junction resolvasome RuvABC endonuclease subunit